MAKIGLQDTLKDTVFKLSEGNPGAFSVLLRFLEQDVNFAPIHMLKLDVWGIYGCRIWMAFKDVMGSDDAAFYGAVKHSNLPGLIREKEDKDARFAKEWRFYKDSSNA